MAEEMAKVSYTVSALITLPSLGAKIILKAGTDEQKASYVPDIAKGRKIISFALTEPNAGSDVGAIKTRAELKGLYYVISGAKCFITLANKADVFVVFAKTDLKAGRNGISAFLIDKDNTGLMVGKPECKMGANALHACEVILDECKVPQECRLGAEGQGFQLATASFNEGRCIIAAQSIGLAQGAADYALKYAKGRIQFGQPIINFQGLQFMLSDMFTYIEAARRLTYYAAELVQDNRPHSEHYAAMAKYFATDVAMKVTTDAVQIAGGHGYMREHPLERMMREAKLLQILEGANQIQRVLVAKSIIGKS